MESYRSPMPRIVPLIASLGCAAVLGGCGEDSTRGMGEAQATGESQSTDAATDTSRANGPRPRGPLLKRRDSQVGRVLFDGNDRALYTFTRDPSRTSRCHGECAE